MDLKRVLWAFSLLGMSAYCQAAPKAGKVFIEMQLPVTGYYSYSSEKVRDELPANIKQGLNSSALKGNDSDILNYGLGLGYHLNDDLSLQVNYVDGIELEDFVEKLFTRDQFNFDMSLFSASARY